MNTQIPRILLIALLALIIATSACESTSPSTAATQLSAPPLATATQTSREPEPSPSPVESPTTEPVLEAEPTVPVHPGLRVVYLRQGNLWSWTQTENNVMLTGTGDMTRARLSGDGQLLAFMRGREAWTVRMDGTDARLLTTQDDEGGALWFAPDGSLLAVSTADHIDVIDLENGTVSRVATYPAIPNGYYPEVVWSADGSGFKTVIPPNSEKAQAEFLFVFTDGKTASLSQFSMVPPSESSPFISPDGGYVIFVAKLGDGKESLVLMDSSGATRPCGEPAESIRAFGWLPDSKHFVYAWENQEQTLILIGNITREPPEEIVIKDYELIRWLDEDHYLATQDDNLYLGDTNGGEVPIAEDVSDFDFGN